MSSSSAEETSPVVRRKLVTTNNEDRKRVILRKVRATGVQEDAKQGGNKMKKLSSDAVEFIKLLIDEDSTLSLQAIAAKVEEVHGV